jgi:hypothetical protein
MNTAAAAAFGVGSATSAGRFRTTGVPRPTLTVSKPTAGFQELRSVFDSRDAYHRGRRCWRRINDLRGTFSEDCCSKTDNRWFKTDRRFSETAIGFEIAAVGPISRDCHHRHRRCWLSDQCWPAGVGSVTAAAAARLLADVGETSWPVPDSGAGQPTGGPPRFQDRPPFPNRGPWYAGILEAFGLYGKLRAYV